MDKELKIKIGDWFNKLHSSDLLTIIIALIIIYACIFKTNYNKPTDIPFLSIGIALLLTPPIHFIIQKIQLYLIKKRFNNDEYIICEAVNSYPKWLSYIAAPTFIGVCIGVTTTIILHPEIHFRRLDSNNINYAIIITTTMLYLFYHFVLRIKTVLTNYGLRSNYKYDTLFSQVKIIKEEIVGHTKILKIYKNHNKQTETEQIPKLYKLTNDKIDNVTGSIMYDYIKTKAKILNTYELYKIQERANDY